MENIKFIKENKITNIKPFNLGWSGDHKYLLSADDGTNYLLRISNENKYDKRKKQFEYLKEIEKLNINATKALEFGVLLDGRPYMITSYLDGKPLEDEIGKLTDTKAYELGYEAGEILKKIHSVKVNETKSWWDDYLIKMERKLKALNDSKYKIPNQEKIIKYYQDNVYLMKERTMALSHGDYHLGNMVINDGKIGIIDFDKVSISDIYDEFKPYCWTVVKSKYFESGLINGYFSNQIPTDFFPILKFYTAESLISHLPWAVSFGQKEIEIALEIAKKIMEWYDDFNLLIPKWYKKM